MNTHETDLQLPPEEECPQRFIAAAEHRLLLKQGWALKNACGAYETPNHLPTLIMAFIDSGAFSRDELIRTLPSAMCHSYRQVARAVDTFAGPCPDQHLWYRDENRTYRLHTKTAPNHWRNRNRWQDPRAERLIR
jgi:hypothetical protein